jgi:thermitase
MKKNKILIHTGIFLILFSVGNFASNKSGPGDFRPEEVICKMMPGESIGLINNSYGTSIRKHQTETGCYLLALQPEQDAESLAVIIDARPDVEYCRVNFYLYAPEPLQRSSAFLDEQNSGSFPDQPAVETLELADALVITDGSDIDVAVIDGGIDLNHVEFQDATPIISGWDYIDDDPIAFDEPGGAGSGHGTFVAGIIHLAAPGASIHAYRVLDTLGRGNGFDIASAIVKAVNDNCRVINLSLGMRGRHEGVESALRYAEGHDVIVVAAAGNDSTGENNIFPYPASKNYCLAVAALDSLSMKADFSNFGPNIDICAPGTQIYSPFSDNLYAWWDGTSFAAPFVSGIAALLISLNPDLSYDEIRSIILESASGIDASNPEFSGQLGSGLINPNGAIHIAARYQRGDANASGDIEVGDAVYIINYVFKAGPAPYPEITGDANCDGIVNIGDSVFLIRCVFFGGPVPCELK